MKLQVLKVQDEYTTQKFLDVPVQIYGEGKVPPQADKRAINYRFMPFINPLMLHVRFANFVDYTGFQHPKYINKIG